ncbi:MAG: hypothetical protein DMF61_07515 [Blastocatellia bacterium AA13]|nr:MAG: hypothetical protein DMF61_07515 [Blastocatellia bacterium AA13]
MRKALITISLCLLMLFASASEAQTRRRTTSKRRAEPSRAAVAKTAAEVQSGRTRIGAEIKTLTQFVFVLGGVSRSIQSAELANRTGDRAAVPVEEIERNKARIRDSFKSVGSGLNALEASFRPNAALAAFYPFVAEASRLGEAAQSQAASNLDEAGRSIIKAVSQLTDALATAH